MPWYTTYISICTFLCYITYHKYLNSGQRMKGTRGCLKKIYIYGWIRHFTEEKKWQMQQWHLVAEICHTWYTNWKPTYVSWRNTMLKKVCYLVVLINLTEICSDTTTKPADCPELFNRSEWDWQVHCAALWVSEMRQGYVWTAAVCVSTRCQWEESHCHRKEFGAACETLVSSYGSVWTPAHWFWLIWFVLI